MSDIALPDDASVDPGPGAKPEYDAWVQQTLGLDVASHRSAGSGSGGVGRAVTKIKKMLKPKKPVPRASLGPAQTARATNLLDKMPEKDRADVEAILTKAKPAEKQYVEKALATNHTARDIKTFYAKISGKDAKWMGMNLHVVGEPSGKGIKQQWRDTCGPTTVQAMMGELDPIYALKLRTENPNLDSVDGDSGTKKNPKAAAEQKRILEKDGGKAVSRSSGQQDKLADGGDRDYGMELDGALNDKKGTTGLEFAIKAIDPTKIDDSLTEMDDAVRGGLPVPLRLADAAGHGHFVLLTGEDPGPPRRYSIHDPWEGKTTTVTEKQIKSGTFKIAGYNRISHFFKPDPVKPKPKTKKPGTP